MEMQDNEFDKLFRSKLDDFEMEPSAKVWPGITWELGDGKRRKSLIPLLGIAASIIVLVTAGILFIPAKTHVISKHPVNHEIAKTNQKVNPVIITKGDVKHDVQKLNTEKNGAPKPVNRMAKLSPVKAGQVTPFENTVQVIKKEQPIKKEEQNTLASVPQKPDVKEVVPGNETTLSIKQAPVEETTGFTAKPILASNPLPVVDKQSATTPVKPKHRIRSLGDLINVVVAKVDKRKDKIIEFTATDDGDESTLTGVNLGIIKIKKDQ
jgi:hypothetical protein